MTMTIDELGKKLHSKLDECIDQLKTSKQHFESLKKETETNIEVKLRAAKENVAAKKQEACAAKEKVEELIEAKKAETTEAVADWKANHHLKKLEKRAEHAEKYAEACIVLARYYAVEADVAILEAVAARQDVDNA